MLWVLLGCRARHAHRHSAATTPCGPVKLAPDRAAALLSRQAASSHVASPCDATWASHRRRPLRRHQHARRPRTCRARTPPPCTGSGRGRTAMPPRAANCTPPSALLSPQRPKEPFFYCSDSLRRSIIPNSTSNGHGGKAEPAVARRLMVKGALTPQPRGRRRRRCRLPLAAHRRPRAPTTSSRPTMTPPPPL
jgi:hypothetical protein